MRALMVVGVAAVVAGCGTTMPPQDLVSARNEYAKAAQGPAASLDPADLSTAKGTLDIAERSFAEDGDTQDTRDNAYLAERRTEIAESRARSMRAQQAKAQTIAQTNADQATTVRRTANALGQANQQLASQGQQLANERQRREDADKRAAQAAADLARIASVKQEARGMVITLSGSVLFASAKSDLLPEAQVKLGDVAKALANQDPDSKIVVEGHTDSQGGATFNQDLSQRRAEAVRSYLVSHGVASDRVSAQGLGPTRPVADNTSTEGRANNRRVEIVVQPSGGSSSP